MNCREFTSFIADWLDGELPVGQAQVFQAHIAMCPPCEMYLLQYQSTVELARLCQPEDAVPGEVPEALIQAILAARPTGDGSDPTQP